MNIWLRKPGTTIFLGPHTREEALTQLTAGTISTDYEALEATGQSFGALKRSTNWSPLYSVFSAEEISSARAATSAIPPGSPAAKMPSRDRDACQFNPKSRAWLLFVTGVVSIPIWFLAFGGRHSSVAAHQAQPFFWFLSLLACVAAPFLSSLPVGKKFAFALLALCACLVVTALSAVLWFAIHGIPIG